MYELHEHLTAHHPGIRQATGPTGMYPQGRPVMRLEVAHEGQHRDDPEYQDHRHNPDGSLVMQTAKVWPEPAVIEAGSPEHLAGFTTDQLRELAASTRPEHIAYGLAAQLELIKRGEQARIQATVPSLADALAGVDQAQVNGFAPGGAVRVLDALYKLADAVRAHLAAHPESDTAS